MMRMGVRAFGLCGLAFALLASACVTRGVATSEETLEGLRAEVRRGATPPPEITTGTLADTNGYYLHASGRVRCDGWLHKKQTAYVTAWVTQPGPDGEIVDVAELSTQFDYRDGLFAGVSLKSADTLTEEVAVHETISGFGDICSCIYSISKVGLLKARLEVRETICPE